MNKLTTGKPLKVILLFAIPLFIGQFFQLCYSLVDTRIVGQQLGETALAAVGATSTLSDLLTNTLNGITNGAAIIIATYFGANNIKDMKKAVFGTIVIGAGFAAIISILCIIFIRPILMFLNVEEQLCGQASAYITIVLAGLVVATFYNAFAAILRAVGDSFTPLIFLVIATVLNVALDVLFVVHMGYGVAGAAIATVISQAVSAILCLFYMLKRYPVLRLCKQDMAVDMSVYKKLLSTGLSMGFMLSFVHIGTVVLQTSINTFGTYIIVAHAGARKATTVFMLPFSVLGNTLATYCGQNLGAGEYKRIWVGIRDTILLTFVWVALVIVVAYSLGPWIINKITASNEPEVLNTAALYLKVNSALYFVPAVICLLRNGMQGFGDSKTPVFSSFLELVCKVLAAYLLAPLIGYWGIIIAEPVSWCIMVVPLIISSYKFMKKHIPAT